MRPHRLPVRHRGFTLIEVMITVAIVAILAAVALPSYNAYIQRSKVPAGLDALSAFATRMEQRYQDVGNYADGANCAVAVPANVANFTITCALGTVAPVNQAFTATATGTGPLSGYVYTINQNGVRNTTHPKGNVNGCWSTRGGTCDS